MTDFLENNPVIAAVGSDEAFAKALQSPCGIIFLLSANILTLDNVVKRCREAYKKLFVHIDMAEGIGKDRCGIEYLKEKGVDGLITTKNTLALAGKRCGLVVVQRFFLIDSKSVVTATESVKSVMPDMVELMPGLILRSIKKFAAAVSVPVIAGGLIETKQDVFSALSVGASAISTSREELWYE